MKLNWMNPTHPNEHHLLFAEPDPAPEGGGDKPKPAGDQKVAGLTQEEVNKIVAAERRTWESKLKEERKAREELNGRYETLHGDFSEFRRLLEEAAEEEGINVNGNGSGDPDLDALERELAIPPGVKDQQTYKLLKKQQLVSKRQLASVLQTVAEQDKTLKAVQTELTEAKTARTKAEQDRKNALREAVIIDALSKNRCIDPAVGLKVVQDQVVFDDETGKYTYIRRDGQKVSVLDGVAAELPKYLIESQTPSGGSGSAGARGVVTDQQMSALETQMNAALEKSQKTGAPRDVANYQTLKRQVNEAKKAREANAAR